jgi:azurin
MKRLALYSIIFAAALNVRAIVETPEHMSLATSDSTEDIQEITIESVGNELKFAQSEITVAAGSKVHLVFVNRATSEGMTHNVVFLRGEESAIERVGLAAISAGQDEYIPKDDAILFHTPLAAPGETVELTFTAPGPGVFFYTCTFPGHYVLMRGVLRVEA